VISSREIEKETNSLASLSQVKSLLQRHDLHLSKRLGQHFLIDDNIRKNIIAAADIKPDDIILEIGPGIGTLTELIAKECDLLIAIELDKRLEPILRETTKGLDNMRLFMGDALKLNIKELVDQERLPNKLISNLPYNISSTLLIRYLEELEFLNDYTVMIQKEVANRIVAKPGSKDYGAFTIKLSFLATIDHKFNISKSVFIPAPNVESSVISLKRRRQVDSRHRKKLFNLIEASFNQRRKKLVNSINDNIGLKKEVILRALSEIEISGDVRAEVLSPNDYESLLEAIEKNKKL